jgi:hypothetical protein
MPRRHDDDVDDEDEDDDLPDGVYHDDELPTVTCPHCRADVIEDAITCPVCNEYMDAPGQGLGTFGLIMMGLAMACALFWAFR